MKKIVILILSGLTFVLLSACVGSSMKETTNSFDWQSIPTTEKNNMMSAITEKLSKHWAQSILLSDDNLEANKYTVKVEVELSSRGEIVGVVKPLVPKIPEGPYLAAFRQANNALISAKTLPIIPDKFPNGLILELTFDPEIGFRD